MLSVFQGIAEQPAGQASAPHFSRFELRSCDSVSCCVEFGGGIRRGCQKH